MRRFTHPSLIAAATAGMTLVVASTITTVPGWLWATCAALTVVGAVQAERAHLGGPPVTSGVEQVRLPRSRAT